MLHTPPLLRNARLSIVYLCLMFIVSNIWSESMHCFGCVLHTRRSGIIRIAYSWLTTEADRPCQLCENVTSSPQNRKYIKYRNAVREGSSHRHRKRAQKFSSVTWFSTRTYRQTDILITLQCGPGLHYFVDLWIQSIRHRFLWNMENSPQNIRGFTDIFFTVSGSALLMRGTVNMDEEVQSRWRRRATNWYLIDIDRYGDGRNFHGYVSTIHM